MPPIQIHTLVFYINGTILVERRQNTSTELASKNHTADGESLLFELTIMSLIFSNTHNSPSPPIPTPNPTSGLAQSSPPTQSRQWDDNPGVGTQYSSSPDFFIAFLLLRWCTSLPQAPQTSRFRDDETEEEDLSSDSPDQPSSSSPSSPSPPAPASSGPGDANIRYIIMTLHTMHKSPAYTQVQLKSLGWLLSESEIQEIVSKESLRKEPSIETEDVDC
ncbi:hypothetical protein MMC22_007435 [Lobaria immixta]|nr:hypothetical protein [Lobaria immixta]